MARVSCTSGIVIVVEGCSLITPIDLLMIGDVVRVGSAFDDVTCGGVTCDDATFNDVEDGVL